MLKKLIILFLLFFVILQVGFSEECSFTSGNCERINEPFIKFDLVVDDNFDKVRDAKLYEEGSDNNYFLLEINDTEIRNLNPLLKTGVYVLEIEVYNVGGLINKIEKKFVFENSDLVPPFIPLEINDSIFEGKTYASNQTIIAQNFTGDEIVKAVSSESNDFTMDLGSLGDGVNYVKFFVETNGVRSPIVERIITNGKVDFIKETVSDINIDSRVSGETTKRNYYVNGLVSGNDGSEVYVNGERALVKDGEFGAFVLLNEGENQIEVVSGDINDTATIEYKNPRFQFLRFDYPKFMISTDERFYVETKNKQKFKIYLNGKFVKESLGDFDLYRLDIKNGKNYIFLEGKNNQRISEIFYYDTQIPEIEVLTNNNMIILNKFIFKVTDDVGVDINSVVIDLNGNKFYSNDMEVKGDFFILDISELSTGGNYVLSVKDLSGKSNSIRSNLNINQDNVLIEDIDVKNGDNVGNYLFFNSTESKVSFRPSKSIVFKKILVNGEEFTSYDITSDNKIHMDFNFIDASGIITMTFMNQVGTEYTQEFFYYTDLEKPILNLDNIEDITGSNDGLVRFSGSVEDSYFNWNNFFINDKHDMNIFGNYFEVYLDLSESNSFVFFGEDISENDFGNFPRRTLTDFFYYDTRIEILNKKDKDSFFEDSYGYTFGSLDKARNYVDSYDGFYSNGMYIYNFDFNLPMPQRYGLRNLNLKGHEDSGLDFEKNEIVLIDFDEFNYSFETASNFYLTGNDKYVSKDSVYLQGNIISQSEVNLVKASLNGKSYNCENNDYSFVCLVYNLEKGKNLIDVEVNIGGASIKKNWTVFRVDLNNLSISFDNSDGEELSGDRVNPINDGYTFSLNEIEANFEDSGNARVSLIIDGKEILFGNEEEIIKVNLSEQIASKNEDEFEVVLKVEDEFGNTDFSETVTLYYTRILQTFINILVY